jgi:hypothetical protein
MDAIARDAFFLFLSAAFAAITIYAGWRMRQRPVRVVVGDVAPCVPMSQVVSPIAADVARDAAIEQAKEPERRETVGAS